MNSDYEPKMTPELDAYLQQIQEPEQTESAWELYLAKRDELERVQDEVEALRDQVIQDSPYKPLVRVRYQGDIFYIFYSKLSVSSQKTDIPSFLLTLTKLTKAGLFPSRPLKSAYTSSENVEVLGRFGDNQNVQEVK